MNTRYFPSSLLLVFLILIAFIVNIEAIAAVKKSPQVALNYGGFIQGKIPEQAILRLQAQFPANLDLVQKRSSPQYARYGAPWNIKCSKRPYLLFAPSTKTEAAAVFKVIRAHKQPCVILAGGHDVQCASTSRSCVLSLKKLNKVTTQYSKDQVIVEAGVLSADLLQVFKGTGIVPPVCLYPTVSVLGFNLGGGSHPFYSNLYGPFADSIISIQAVLANGKTVHATRSNEYKDLLWALLGIGGGRLALVLEATFHLHKNPSKVFKYHKLQVDFTKAGIEQEVIIRQFVRDWADLVVSSIPKDTGNFLTQTRQTVEAQSICHSCNWTKYYELLVKKYKTFVKSNITQNLTPQDIYLKHNNFSIDFKAKNVFNQKALWSTNYATSSVNGIYSMQGVFSGARLPVLDIFLDDQLTERVRGQFTLTDMRNHQWHASRPSFPFTGAVWGVQIQAQFGPGHELDTWLLRMKNLQTILQTVPEYLGTFINWPSCWITDDRYYYGHQVAKLEEVKEKYDPNDFFHRNVCS